MICPSCHTANERSVDVCFHCGKALSALTKGALLQGRYEVVDVLGRGGMGLVYKAYDRVLDEVMAIKVLRRDLTETPELSKRFRSEIKLARRVSHPNVCRIHEYGEDAGLTYISMAYVEGADLRRLLQDSPDGLPPDEAFDIAIQVARGLQAIHDVGIIHRDLKTPNIMRDAQGVVRLMDFGIAKEFRETGSGAVTATGAVMGTPEYMSPEQCRGEKLDARSDLYSLGIVTFEIFTGQVPFRGDSVMATLFKHIQEPPPLTGPLAGRLPESLLPVLQRCLAKEREERFPSAAETATALERARSHPAARRPQRPPVERRTHTRLEIPLNVRLKRLDGRGQVLQEERTIADNLSRGGARVMTAMANVGAGEVLLLEEIGGDFHTRVLVRHAHVGADRIRRLGLEFLERAAPDRLVQTGEWRSSVARGAWRETPRSRAGAGTPRTAGSDRRERRTSSRLEIPLDVVLKRLGGDGAVVEQERTFTENIGQGGARVMTALTSVAAGDVVLFAEVGGDFETRATVRHSYFGNDRVRRLNLEFLDRPAPDRLVATAEERATLRHHAPRGRPQPGS